MKRFAETRRFTADGVAGSGSGSYTGCASPGKQARMSATATSDLTIWSCTARSLSRRSLLLSAQDLSLGNRPEIAPLDLLGGHRPAEQITLILVALQLVENLELLLLLHAFGDDADAQAAAHGDDRAHDREALRRRADVAEESAVDLERIDAEMPDVPQRREARAEVVDGHPGAE